MAATTKRRLCFISYNFLLCIKYIVDYIRRIVGDFQSITMPILPGDMEENMFWLDGTRWVSRGRLVGDLPLEKLRKYQNYPDNQQDYCWQELIEVLAH
jgi:hypothetical protein